MNLTLDEKIGVGLHSGQQKARVITEGWVAENLYCPYCGNPTINHFENNRPVADFYCPNCKEQFELKSRTTPIKNRIADGAYDTLIKRIEDDDNPNFLFMQYEIWERKVLNLVVVPKYFISVNMVEPRKPLSENAERAGRTGSNIIYDMIPREGRIFAVRDSVIAPERTVIEAVRNTKFIEECGIEKRSWLLDILKCVDSIKSQEFTLERIYVYADKLQKLHPMNHHIKDKIRQQLQLLRDKGLIEFCGDGKYKKIKY